MRFTIVITGVTKGLGRALAEQYIHLDHTVIGCGRNIETITEMKTDFPVSTNFQVVNIDDHQQVQDWAKNILSRFGAPDFLLNNAGIINKN